MNSANRRGRIRTVSWRKDRHQQRQRLKEQVDARIARRRKDTRGLLLVFTGNGERGKTTAAFGTVTRAVGGMRAGVIQFIKGEWPNGEKNLLQQHGVEFQVMTPASGRHRTKPAIPPPARQCGNTTKRMLANSSLDLVLLDRSDHADLRLSGTGN